MAFAVFMFFFCVLLFSRDWVGKSLGRQLRLEAQVNLQVQKSVLEAAFNTNVLLVQAAQALILGHQEKDLKSPYLINELKNMTLQLLPLSDSILAFAFVTGNPQQPWTASIGFNKDTTKPWVHQESFQSLAVLALSQSKLITKLLSLDNQKLLLMAQPVFDQGQHWGFVFVEIDFLKLTKQFNQTRKQAIYTMNLYIPDSLDFNNPPVLNAPTVKTNLQNNGLDWHVFATPNTSWYAPLLPLGFALLIMVLVSFGIAYVAFLLNFSRVKSQWLAMYDALTGAANRRQLEQFFKNKIAYVHAGSKGCLLLFNVDNFKAINETHGFAVGDQVLIEIAARLSQCLQAKEFLARLGNDEFVIIIPHQERGAITNLSHKIQSTMTEPMLINQRMISLVTIVGSSRYPQHGTDLNALVEHADHHIVRDDTESIGAE